MKRHAAKIISAFLIMVIALNIMPPLRAVAQHPNVTIYGTVYYPGRNFNPNLNNYSLAQNLLIAVYNQDSTGNHLMGAAYTNTNGYFQFLPMENWDYVDSRRLYLYFTLTPDYFDSSNAERRVAHANVTFDNWVLSTSPSFAPDGDYNISLNVTTDYQILWIFDDLGKAWKYVYNNDNQYDPKSVTAVWEPNMPCFPVQPPQFLQVNCGSFTYGGPIAPHFIFISDSVGNINSMDVAIHETGHMYMVNANGYWYFGCLTHYMFITSDVHCAWSEGWADFFPLAVNGDQCYNRGPNSCQGTADTDYYNLEAHSRADNQPLEDTVEGRVAGALYDLYDSNNEGFDRISTDFYHIAYFALGGTQITSFYDFWSNHWEFYSGQNSFLSGLTLWWNTIGYINIRQNYLPTVMKQP